MPKSGKHLTLESREIVEQGIRDGDPASKIARRLRVAASTNQASKIQITTHIKLTSVSSCHKISTG